MAHNMVTAGYIGGDYWSGGTGRFKQRTGCAFAIRRKYDAISRMDVGLYIVRRSKIFNDACSNPFINDMNLNSTLMFRIHGAKNLEASSNAVPF